MAANEPVGPPAAESGRELEPLPYEVADVAGGSSGGARVSVSSNDSHRSHISSDPLVSLSPRDPPRRSAASTDSEFDDDFSTDSDDLGPPAQPGAGIENNDLLQYYSLLKASENGDWAAMKRFLDDHPGALTAKITCRGLTALHVAAEAGHVHIVEELVQLMSESDLEIQDKDGGTALLAAAATGITQIASFMVGKNRRLATIASSYSWIPVTLASNYNHLDMVRYLYSVTPLEGLIAENEKHGATLVVHCIFAKIFDVALDLLQRYPRLALAREKGGLTPILALAQMPCVFPSGKELKFWQEWLYSCIKIQPLQISRDNSTSVQKAVECQDGDGKTIKLGRRLLCGLGSAFLKLLGIKKLYDMKLIHAQGLELLDLMCKEIPALNIRQLSQSLVYGAILEAVMHGNAEFLVSVIKANPSLLWTIGKSKRGIFMYAVEYRQEKIFSLIYGLGARKYIAGRRDCTCNNMLHLAGMLPPAAKLDQVTGAALQMQREMQWFKEVESILHPKFKKERCMLRTPHELFTDNHKDLKKKGEEWMKDTARPCMIVSAIVFAIVFAAAFNIPSSYNPHPAGFPLFWHSKRFTIFMVSYALSLFGSLASLLTFIVILTSRYAEEDFLKSLPAKMILGLLTLFVSVGAMVVAFCAALGSFLDGRTWVSLTIILLASLPFIVFVLLQLPILFEMFMSTFGPSIFSRKMKRWL